MQGFPLPHHFSGAGVGIRHRGPSLRIRNIVYSVLSVYGVEGSGSILMVNIFLNKILTKIVSVSFQIEFFRNGSRSRNQLPRKNKIKN
jgi:hypothetical protein